MRGRNGAVLAIVALMLTACGQQPPAPAPPEEPAGETVVNEQEMELQSNRQCIIAALNATINNPQSADALVNTMFAQNLHACPADFKQAFIALRHSARDYLPIANEVVEHAKLADPSLVFDGVNVLCGIARGEQCAPSFTAAWVSADSELRQRAADAKGRMDAAKDALELIAAGYDVYSRTEQPASVGNVQ